MTFQQKLSAGRFVISAEVTPPVSFDRDELLAWPTSSTLPMAPAPGRISAP
jgi:hypothetical protein